MNFFSTLSTKLMAVGIGLAIILLAVVVVIAMMQQKPASDDNTAQNQDANSQQEFIEAEHALVDDFPGLPVYPGAELEESSKRVQPIDSNRDFKAEWHTTDAVPTVTDWYLAELPKMGWTIDEAPNDRAADEQIINVSKDDLVGYIAVEFEFEDDGDIVEIVADFRKAVQ